MINTKDGIKIESDFFAKGNRILTYDTIFKSVFGSSEELMARIISIITKIDINILKDNIVIQNNEIPITHLNEKFKKCDFVVKINKYNVINLELNNYNNASSRIKNYSYICSLFGRLAKKGENYNENALAIQININAFDTSKKSKPLDIYSLKNEITNEKYTEENIGLRIFEFNLDKCSELYYNDIESKKEPFIALGALFYNDDITKAKDIINGCFDAKESKLIMEKIESLKDNDRLMSQAEAEKRYKIYLKSAKKEYEEKAEAKGMKKGIEKGIKKGIKQGVEQTIKNMLNLNLDKETISKVSGKTIAEIEKIESEN